MPDFRVKTQKELAAFFGVATRTVQSWLSDGCPAGKPGAWDLSAVARWRIARAGDDKPADLAQLKAAKLQADTDLANARAALARQKEAIESGDLIDAKEARLQFVEGALTIKARLESLAEECTSSIPREFRIAVEREVENKVYLALKELAATIPVQGLDLEEKVLAVADEIRARRLALEGAGDE